MAATTLSALRDIYISDGMLQASDTSKDDKIERLIPVAEDACLKWRGRAWDVDDDDNIVYDLETEEVIADLIGWKIWRTKRGLQQTMSHQLGERINVTFKDEPMIYGFPLSLINGQRRFLL